MKYALVIVSLLLCLCFIADPHTALPLVEIFGGALMAGSLFAFFFAE